jgi:hypothetical protein
VATAAGRGPGVLQEGSSSLEKCPLERLTRPVTRNQPRDPRASPCDTFRRTDGPGGGHDSISNNQKKGGKGKKKGAKKRSQRVVTLSSTPAVYQSSFRGMGGKGSQVYQKTELFASYGAGSVDYKVLDTFAINPGNSALFPWLSKMAVDWQQFRFHDFQVHYQPSVGTARDGNVIISPDYDSTNPVPADEKVAVNTQDAVELSVSVPRSAKLDTRAMFPSGPQSRKLVRLSPIIGDRTLYDCGNLTLATIASDPTKPLGRFEVSYTVEFFVPQTSSSITVPPVTYAQKIRFLRQDEFATGYPDSTESLCHFQTLQPVEGPTTLQPLMLYTSDHTGAPSLTTHTHIWSPVAQALGFVMTGCLAEQSAGTPAETSFYRLSFRSNSLTGAVLSSNQVLLDNGVDLKTGEIGTYTRAPMSVTGIVQLSANSAPASVADLTRSLVASLFPEQTIDASDSGFLAGDILFFQV